MNTHTQQTEEYNRRDFLRGGSLATLMAMMGGIELRAADDPKADEGATQYKTTSAPVNCAVIGCGIRGREILATLARLPNAPVVAVCDTYAAFLKRGRDAAPKAEGYADYKQLLANKDVQGVFVATPSHQHREVVLAALQAGKHVYCEVPLASSLEDTRAIAQAAKAAERLYFQAGLQRRSDPQSAFLSKFVRSGAAGKTVKARAQWHKKQSWRRTSPNPEREKELNWRLNAATSGGLAGEVGIHQLDILNWLINERPVSVLGLGSTLLWNDGREQPDTVQLLVEYPGGVRLNYEASLATSFDADYEILYGTDSAILMRGSKAWMFKEVDAPLLGWEVYAVKEQFYKETGIVLAADASVSAKQGKKPAAGADAEPVKTALQDALEAFITNAGIHASGVEDFIATFGEDAKGLKEYMAGLAKNKKPHAGFQEGFEATVLALKANEAVLKGGKIDLQKEWFQV